MWEPLLGRRGQPCGVRSSGTVTGREEAPGGAQPQGGAAWPEGLGPPGQTPLGKTQISRARLLARPSGMPHIAFSDFPVAFRDHFLHSLEIQSYLTLPAIIQRL